MAIVLRTVKGSALTHEELDNNFDELQNVPAVALDPTQFEQNGTTTTVYNGVTYTIPLYRIIPSVLGGGSGNITPSAPTGGTVDDTANTFTFTLSSGYVAADHEYSTNSGSTWTVCSSNVINVGDVAIAIGVLQVRVKAATGRNASSVLSNSTAFTVTGGGSSSILFEAQFTAANGTSIASYTPETGTLSSLVGSMEIQSNKLVAASGTDNKVLTNSLGSQSYTIEALLQKSDVSLNAFIYFHSTDINNLMVAVIGNNIVTVYNIVSGSLTQVGTFPIGVESTSAVLWKVVVTPTSATFYRDNAAINNVTLPTGQVGTKSGVGFTGTPGQYTCDYFKITS
jgi:hypothetical protein